MMTNTTGTGRDGHVAHASALGDVAWRKSTASGTGNCVELAALPDGAIAARNSRDPHGPAILLSRADVAALIGAVKAGELDDLAE